VLKRTTRRRIVKTGGVSESVTCGITSLTPGLWNIYGEAIGPLKTASTMCAMSLWGKMPVAPNAKADAMSDRTRIRMKITWSCHSERPAGAKNLASASGEIPFGCTQDMLQSLLLFQNDTITLLESGENEFTLEMRPF